MTFTVLSVAPNPRSYDANGPKLAYKVRFTEHADKDVEWSQKAETAAPTVGQQVDGNIDWAGRFGPKFTREYQQQGGSAGGGGSTWKPRDPKEIAAIQRQHSQSVAVDYLRYRVAAGDVPAEWLTRDGLADLIDWFQRDIERGVTLAEKDNATATSYGKQKDSESTGRSDVPPPAEGEFVAPPSSPAENEMWATT